MARFSHLLPITSLLLPLLGCSDSIPPAAEGAWSLTFSSVATQGKVCGITTHNRNIGAISPTELDPSGLRKHTIADSKIHCQVIQRGANFSVDGSNTLGGLMLSMQVGDVAGGATEAEPALGSLSFKSDETQNTFSSPGEIPCEFWFGTNKQQIAPGRVWMQFECDAVQHLSTDSSCAITNGVVAFQNCEQ